MLLRFNSCVSELNLACNSLDRKCTIELFFEALVVHASLTSLNLTRNGIGDIGAKFLADGLRVNASLTELNLQDNDIGPAGGQAIFEALHVNASLTEVLSFL